MHSLQIGSHWPMVVFAVIAVALLAIGTFKLDEPLFRRKKPVAPGPRKSNQRFQGAEGNLSDPDGRPSKKKRG